MSQILKNYASAIFEISLEKDSLNDDYKTFKEILILLEENPKFKNLLANLFISKEERNSIVDNVFKGKINEHLLSFIHVIIDNGRADELSQILKEFISLYNDHFGIVEGICYSSFKLNEKQLNDLMSALSKRENKKVYLINKINKELIGGVKIIIGDRVYDSSINATIDNIKKNLLA